jgi:DNA polymerase-3 subunit epsilon
MLRGIDSELENVKLNGTQSNLAKSLIEGLPKQAGVYYFYNNTGQLIYVGKSINIHDRVLSHLNNNLHKKAVEMKNAIAHVGFELTGSELVALLLESAEIKKHQPLYNSQQKRTFFNYGLYSFFDDQGYLNLKIIRIINALTPIYTYSSAQEGKEHLFRLVEEFRLCQKLCGLYDTSGACFHFQISQCDGACVGSETTDTYNRKVQTAIEEYNFENSNFFILENGRLENENAVVKVENGKYQGFGYIQTEIVVENHDALHECIKCSQDNREVRQIINTYLKKNKRVHTILF